MLEGTSREETIDPFREYEEAPLIARRIRHLNHKLDHVNRGELAEGILEETNVTLEDEKFLIIMFLDDFTGYVSAVSDDAEHYVKHKKSWLSSI